MEKTVDDIHTCAVDAWLIRAAVTQSPQAFVTSFRVALDGIRGSAARTLGPVTLNAVANRVLANAVDRNPLLAGLASGGDLANVPYGTLLVGTRSVLVELLALLGSLTAEILTPELHAELARTPDLEVESRQQRAS